MSGYLRARPERCSMFELILSLILPGRKCAFIECRNSIKMTPYDEVINESWKLKFSLFFMKLLKSFSGPLATLGDWIEFILNLFFQNGGFLKTISNYFKGSIIIPKKGSETFISFIGHLDPRMDLMNRDALKDFVKAPGSTSYADLCIMAAKLSYQNEAVIRNVGTNRWKMHFVGFFNFWNDYLQTKSTQAFILCEEEVDAKLVVIAFGGTAPFDAGNWMTDFDISWYESKQLGSVHLGFLEALGLANRSNIPQISDTAHSNGNGNINLINAGLPPDFSTEEDPEKPLAYHTLCERLTELLKQHKNAKFIVTGHSLGGALAVLFPAILFLQEEEKLLEKLLAVYTFGQPRVGDRVFANFMEKNLNHPKPRYFRIVYSNDIVPRLPYDDHIFMYKHFGVCIYYNSCYREQNRAEEPNRNFSLVYLVSMRLNAVWELIQSLLLRYRKGKEFKEAWLSMMSRIVGLLLPGVSAHSPVNYVNAVRLGPSLLTPTLPVDRRSRKAILHHD
eukprot:Gb_06716 [translate_table: standard]